MSEMKVEGSKIPAEDITNPALKEAIETMQAEGSKQNIDNMINKVIEAKKHITPYIAFDSDGERQFAEALESATEVQVYAKLPRKLKIPTPVGSYAPDWAIVFYDGTVRHVFFVAETKGSLDGMELRGVEKAKTECAKKLFNRISTSKVRYGVVDKFENLYNLINGID